MLDLAPRMPGRRGIRSFTLWTLVAIGLLALQPVAAKKSGPPPVLDRELFFGDPEISGSQISPDGKFIAFIKPLNDVRNIWVKRTEEPFEAAKPITADPHRPIPGYFWSRDGKFILFVQDKDGNENYNVFKVDPAASPAEGQQVPEATNLTDVTGARAMIYSVPRDEPDVIYVGLNDRDASWHDLYRVKLSTGERTLIRKNTDRIAGWTFDLKGHLRLAARIADDGSTEILRVSDDGYTPVYTCSPFESCGPVRFHKDGKRVYMVTNKGDGVDLLRLVLFDPESGKEELVESDPLGRVDFGNALFSEVTDELVATFYEDERTRDYWRDKAYEADYRFLQKKLRGKDIGMGSHTRDERMWTISASSDTEPGESYLFDRKTRKLTRQYRIFDKLPREYLAPMRAVHYESSDGLDIPAFLTTPKGVKAKDLPLVVVPHGGPWYRDHWGYDAFAQFLANRGYAVLQPNFRGSTGYGKKFLNAGNLEWGRKMQDDITWGVKYLVADGVADPEHVGIMGGSYGGYATLAGVAFTPDLYAAGVSIVGPSNLITLLDSIPPYWEAIRTIFYVRMGDPSTPEGKAMLERRSPLNSADKIKTPLLVVQGANDPRVNKAESEQIVVALRDRKFPVEYLLAPDEGHGFARPINNLAMFAAAEKFLAEHLGGRYQEDMTPEVADKLSELTVDVATVKLPEKVDEASVGVPEPAFPLVPGTYAYQSKIEAGGQEISIDRSVEVREEAPGWVVIETAKSPMGEGTDRTELDKDGLTLVSRSVKQGPVSIELKVENAKLTGSMAVGGAPKPLSADLGGALFADGAGSRQVLATLPLAEGYSTTYRNFDLQRQKETLHKLEVAGVESVTVPAGEFEAWRVEIASAEGAPGSSTVWVDRATRKVIKMKDVVPAMGGAVVTSELKE